VSIGGKMMLSMKIDYDEHANREATELCPWLLIRLVVFPF